MSYIIDYDNNDEYCTIISEDTAVSEAGHTLQKFSNHTVMDLETGEMHFTSDWPEEVYLLPEERY